MLIPETEILCQMLKINLGKLSKEEKIVFESELFIRIYDELKQIISVQNKEYFRLMKFNEEMEREMIENDFIRCIINDILVTKEYSLSGIAYYTQTPEDVIYEIVVGLNNSPSITLSRKVMGLHRMVRPNLYEEILKKISSEFRLEKQ